MGVIFEEVTAEIAERPAVDEVASAPQPDDTEDGHERLLRRRHWQAEWATHQRRQARLETD